MKTINSNQLLEQLNWRYATKQFDPKRKISAQDWATLGRSLVADAIKRRIAAVEIHRRD